MEKFKKILFLFSLSILTSFFIFAKTLKFLDWGFAQEIKYPPVPEMAPPTATTTFPEYVKYLFNLAIISGGIIALAVIIWAGFSYFSSATSGEKKTEAKKKIISAFLGLIILLGAYVILATINPQLTILSLQPVTPPSTTPPPSPTTPTIHFQEIPIGTLTENILAKNIGCFDKEKNLIDCQESQCSATTSGYICKDGMTHQSDAISLFSSDYPNIATSALIFVPRTDFRYCYTYDSNGNKKELLEYKDQYECIKNLLPALKVKTEKLASLTSELEQLAKTLKDKSEELQSKANNCKCTVGCSRSCQLTKSCSCKSQSCSCSCSCSNNSDLCPDRARMNDLRRVEIPQKIIELEKKRIEIYAFIYGADEKRDTYDWYQTINSGLSNPTTTTYYLPQWDPYATSTFLTFQEGIDRLKSFIDELNNDLNDLKEAENLMKSPYGDRLTLIEFLDLKEKDPRIVNTDKFRNQHFNDYEIDKYCYEFNCRATTTYNSRCTGVASGAVCNECATSTEGRMCRIKVEAGTSSELYVFQGDPATFYYHDEYLEERVLTKEKCNIESKTEQGFAIGLIPIGETVDETEEFATRIIAQLQGIYNELVSARDEACSARDNAASQISNAWNLIDLTSPGTSNKSDCVTNCEDVPCTCSCSCSCNCDCACCDGGEDCEGGCSCSTSYSCTQCSTDSCPFGSISTAVSNIQGHYNNILNLYTSLSSRPAKIQSYSQQFINLVEAKTDPNRCTILHKLTNSRKKLQKCFTGYGFALKEGKVKKRVFGSKIGLDLFHRRTLVILPDNFFYPVGKNCINAYPYDDSNKLSSPQKQECRRNRVSTDCWNAISDLLENYYCCQTVP